MVCGVEGLEWCLLSAVCTPQHEWCASQCVVVCDDSACLVLSCRVVGCGMAVV